MKQKGRLFLAGLILAFGLESAAAAGTWEDGVILPEPEVQIQTEASGEAAEAGQVGEFPAEELSGAEISEMTEIPAEPAVSEETADPGILSGEGSEEAESAGDPEIILDILPAEDVPAYAAEDFDAEAVPETEDKDAWGIQAAEEPFPGAAAVKLDRSCTGSVSPSAPENCYKFTITQTGVLNLGAKSADISRMRYALYNSQGEWLWSADPYMNGDTGLNTLNEDLYVNPGTFYLVVSELKDSSGSYEFTLSNDGIGESFPETDGGSDNSLETANRISAGVQYTGQISLNDLEDYYRFTLPSASKVDIEISGTSCTLGYQILNESGKEVCGSGGHLTKGTYYFRASRRYQELYSSYNIKMSVEEEKETFQESDGGSNNTIPTASAIKLGKEYYFQVGDNDDKDYFSYVVTKTQKITLNYYRQNQLVWQMYDSNGSLLWDKDAMWDFKNTSFEMELSAGTYYLCVLRHPYTGYGSYSFSITGYAPASAQFTSAANTAAGIRLTWNEVPNATGYKLYRRTESGSFKLLKKITKGTTVSYVDKSAVNGVVYRYKLRTMEGTFASVYSTPRRIARLTGKGIAGVVNTAGQKAVVRIRKNPKATGYQVQYAYNSKFTGAGKKTVTTNSCTISGLKKNTVCYVRVRSYIKAYGKIWYSAWSGASRVAIRK